MLNQVSYAYFNILENLADLGLKATVYAGPIVTTALLVDGLSYKDAPWSMANGCNASMPILNQLEAQRQFNCTKVVAESNQIASLEVCLAAIIGFSTVPVCYTLYKFRNLMRYCKNNIEVNPKMEIKQVAAEPAVERHREVNMEEHD